MKNRIYIDNHQNKVEVSKEIKQLVKKSCNVVLKLEGFSSFAEISVVFIDNKGIRSLNELYRSINKETDVLSFPLAEEEQYDKNKENSEIVLGDIVISIEKAIEQAELYGHTLQREIAYLTVHSMYHLLGYDHEISTEQATQMRLKEEEALNKLGISRVV